MRRTFFKYEGAGNDFILFDDRDNTFDIHNVALIHRLCDRHFGIGADGLILLRNRKGYDFEMIYFNSDGRPGSMCGNGGRCISGFASDIGALKKNEIRFMAADGEHSAIIGKKTVKLKMKDVADVETSPDYFFLDTGSPHVVKFLKNVDQADVYGGGRKIRYSERFSKNGTNVNFVEERDGDIFVRTYERGVENETLSCGTGVTASALATAVKNRSEGDEKIAVHTRGGALSVHFKSRNNHFTDVWLEGPATFVFKGEIEV